MREPRYSILADIQDAIEQAKCGKLALYWQRTIQREYSCKKATPAEQQAYEQLQSILSEVPQWSGEEDSIILLLSYGSPHQYVFECIAGILLLAPAFSAVLP